MQPVRFRHSASAAVAALLGAAGAVPLTFTLWYPLLTPLLLVPVGILAWAVRCGTDAGPAGVRVRALFASRLLPWSDLDGFAPAGRGVVALTRRGGQVPLPAVARTDLPRLATLARASDPAPAAPATDPTDPTDPAG